MKTILLCAALMAAAVAAALWSSREVDRLCADARALISAAEQEAENGDFPSASDSLGKAGAIFSEKNSLLVSIHNNTQIREISAAIGKAQSCAESGDIPGLKENAALAAELIEALSDTDRVTLGNVL